MKSTSERKAKLEELQMQINTMDNVLSRVEDDEGKCLTQKE